MIITAIEKSIHQKYKVYIDGEYVFFLYFKDIRSNDIKEGQSIGTEEIEKIKLEVVYIYAKKKAMNLLLKMDRTEEEIRRKLKESFFQEDAIDQAVEYLYRYHYLDDERYTKNYIAYKKGAKSPKELEFLLKQKGVSREIIKECLEEYKDEDETIRKLIKKKTDIPTELPEEKKKKIIASLCRKGFSYEKVRNFFY